MSENFKMPEPKEVALVNQAPSSRWLKLEIRLWREVQFPGMFDAFLSEISSTNGWRIRYDSDNDLYLLLAPITLPVEQATVVIEELLRRGGIEGKLALKLIDEEEEPSEEGPLVNEEQRGIWVTTYE